MRSVISRRIYAVVAIVLLVLGREELLRVSGSHVAADCLVSFMAVPLLLRFNSQAHWSIWLVMPAIGAAVGEVEAQAALSESVWQVLTSSAVYYGLFIASLAVVVWRLWPTGEQAA